jgi:hypothetical protein
VGDSNRLSPSAWASAFEALVEIATKHPDPILRVSATGKEGLHGIIEPSQPHPAEGQLWPVGYAIPVYQASTLKWLVDSDEQVRSEADDLMFAYFMIDGPCPCQP